MGLTRGSTRPLLFIALVALIASADVAEAGFLGGFRGAFKGIMDKVKGLLPEVMEQNTKKTSILSKFFGDGKTRGDLTLPQIFNNVFSRNNGIIVTNSNANDKDWELGDGSNVIAAMSTGGSISVSTNNGVVSITTGTSSNANEHKGNDDKVDKDENKGGGKKEKEEEKKERGDEDNDSDSGGSSSTTDSGSDSEDNDFTESPRQEHDDRTTFSGSDLDNAFIELLSDWNSFVTSKVWDVQDAVEPEPSTEVQADDVSLGSSSRIINGVFLGNRVASGAPFAVKFFYNNEENFYCSGSLVGYPYALTAAHCGVVVGDEVRVGGRLLRSGYKATVAEVFTHPKFGPASLVHDFAIVRLDGLEDKKVLKENGVKAARINRNYSFPENSFVGVVSAHGSVETDGQGVSEQLRSTRHAIHAIEKCKDEITQGDIKDEENYLCAGDGERSTTCVGDSGAGLWRYRVKSTARGKTRRFYEIFGVVSFGEVTDEALCPRGPPTVFQRTSSNYEWIQEIVGKKNMP